METAQMEFVHRHADAAGRAIPPVWPLVSSVAVNPYLGQTSQTLAETSARLARVAGLRSTMPREWYARQIDDGSIIHDDLEAALLSAPAAKRPSDLHALREAMIEASPAPEAIPTIADLARDQDGIDWPGLIADRFGAWAAGYFDQGQALWMPTRHASAYADWKEGAARDLTPEIIGLTGFCDHVDRAPGDARQAIEQIVSRLGLNEAELPTYFHSLLMTLGGWAQCARYRLWEAELRGASDDTIIDLLAIRLVWEDCLHKRHADAIAEPWSQARAAHGEPVVPSADQIIDAILQQAAERTAQRRLGETLAAAPAATADSRPALLAAFCIDVRSEVFRRALESIDPNIVTLGFAGFFGLPVAHRRMASDVDENRLPVLLSAGVHSHASVDAEQDILKRYRLRAKRAWGRFRLAAVSSFAFVEAAGPVYAGRLLRDTMGMCGKPTPIEPKPVFTPQMSLEDRVQTAETVLRAMSLTEDFALIVLLAGHGANVVNNPHASALHCGACGGYSGEVNARLLAGLLNDPEVRNALPDRGIDIPSDTIFIGALHDTTTDQVTLFDADHPISDHKETLAETRKWLDAAGKITRAERALRLPRASDQKDLFARARDWAEVRPEWALAGCKAFIAAPRHRTAGRDLEGSAFLHDYAWKQDSENGFGVLELIMTAPVVVASWISLQYYGSSVAPEAFGGGNKLLHNVTGGIGVVEGNGGLLRAGLPWQSVHDGEGLVHDPLRLTVCIEAPREAMSDILKRHEEVRALFDNQWLHLFALDESGQMAWRYAGDLEWEAVATRQIGEEKAVA